MLGKTSPFKKLSHSRGGSVDEHHHGHSMFHRRTASISSNNNHPPVTGHKRSASRSSNSSTSSNFLAEQYERDRKGIITHCFSKNDPKTGLPISTYITHVRIIEDSRYPSSRAPKNSPLINKKKRFLIVSARSNGAGMQLHKARENSNGSFQIGRTWDLKELTCIERDLEQPEGFLFTMGKKYYWETNSAKERTIFIKSLVKIYMDNSAGRIPQLINWDLSMFYLDENSYQRAVVSGSVRPQQQQQQQQQKQQQQHQQQNKPVMLPNAIPPPDNAEPIQKYVQTQTQAQSKHVTSQKSGGLNNAPYSQSTTVAQLSKSLTSQTPVQVHTASKSPTRSQDSSTGDVSQQTSKIGSQSSKINSNTDETATASSIPSVSKSEGKDTFLEELNTVLTSPAQNVDFAVCRKSYQEVEMETDPKADDEEQEPEENFGEHEDQYDEEDFTELYRSNSDIQTPIDGDTTMRSQNDTYGDEDTNELSFEKGDEIRYSQLLDGDQQHDYHEVSTIQEETSTRLIHEGDATELNTDVKQTEGEMYPSTTDGQALIESLDEINWEVDDDASRLLDKLQNKLAETEYIFNKELLKLSGASKDLSPYENRVFVECDKLDPTLSFFSMELASVSQDIEFVESQANGLQVEAANKKMLWKELSDILSSVSVDESSLRELLSLPISERNLGRIEQLLFGLYTALKAIRGDETEQEYNLGEIRALKERRQAYERVTALFLKRVVDEMDKKFINIDHGETSDEQLNTMLSRMLSYSSLTLFCKDVSIDTYSQIIQRWNKDIQRLYDRRTYNVTQQLRPVIADVSSQSQRLSNQQGEKLLLACWDQFKKTKTTKFDQPSNSDLLDVTVTSISSMEKLCITYQNFIDSFFHITTTSDFGEYIKKFEPSSRSVPLNDIKKMESNRESALLKNQLVTTIFQQPFSKFFVSLFQLTRGEQHYIPVIILYLENRMASLRSTNQEFLLATFKKAFEKLKQEWYEFIDEQVVYVERAEINFKSRSVSSFMFGLPLFIKKVEDLIAYVASNLKLEQVASSECRGLLNKSYNKLGESILKLLTKDDAIDANITALESSGAPEKLDKCISLLINSNWLQEMLAIFGNETLFEFVQESKNIFDREKEIYADALVKESMSRLVTFIEGAYGLVGVTGSRRVDPSKWAAYSQQNLDKILKIYTSREINELIQTLYGNMEAHFLKESNNNMREQLCDKLWSCIQGQTVSVYLKLYSLIDKHYKGSSVSFTKNDIITAFNSHKKDF